jgi:MFS family permease
MKQQSPPGLAVASLLMAVFVIAMGYGLLLPVLPAYVAHLDPGASQREILWHMGLVTAVYAGAALLVAPIWGRFADWSSARIPIALSLFLSGAASIAGGYSSGMLELYGWRFVAGIGAGAVGPSVQVWLSRWDGHDSTWRSRRTVWVGLATTAGFFIGPFVGAVAVTAATAFDLSAVVQQRMPFFAAGSFVLAVAAAVFLLLPPAPSAQVRDPNSVTLIGRLLPWLLPIGTPALAISTFEVGLSAMASGQELDTWQVGLLFAQCTLFMFAAQSILLLPSMRHQSLKALIIPALLLLAAGLIATVFASGTGFHVLATGMVAAGGGFLPAVLARELAVIDKGAIGASTGLQSAASQLGQTVGAVLSAAVATIAEPSWALVASAIAILASGLMFFATAAGQNASQHPEAGV